MLVTIPDSCNVLKAALGCSRCSTASLQEWLAPREWSKVPRDPPLVIGRSVALIYSWLAFSTNLAAISAHSVTEDPSWVGYIDALRTSMASCLHRISTMSRIANNPTLMHSYMRSVLPLRKQPRTVTIQIRSSTFSGNRNLMWDKPSDKPGLILLLLFLQPAAVSTAYLPVQPHPPFCLSRIQIPSWVSSPSISIPAEVLSNQSKKSTTTSRMISISYRFRSPCLNPRATSGCVRPVGQYSSSVHGSQWMVYWKVLTSHPRITSWQTEESPM